MNLIKKLFFILIITLFLFTNFLYLSFDLFKINSYSKINYYIPVLNILNKSNKEDIFAELDKNVKFFNSVVFNTNSFLFSRESKRKGFVRDVYLDIKEIKIDYKVESYENIDGFYYLFKINIPIDDNRRERISNFMKISGFLVSGEASDSLIEKDLQIKTQNLSDNKDNFFIKVFKNSIVDMINNAILIKFGKNFMLDIKGSFIITEQPFYIINSGNLYIKIKGLVFIEN
ncbi:MAG: hypothetical protein N3A58_04650 [Spirochaetes bacterium]|nr:hypothetical protein [Spirochaetota bacterium]